MAESKSVLAHLMPSFYQPIEDRGTDALAYILNRSEACRGALSGLLHEAGSSPDPMHRFKTQVQFDDGKSIVDMVGNDGAGKNRLMVEVKFWAILQPRQAWRYYQHLEESGPGVLLFICPERAITNYWPEVCAQLEEDEEEPIPLEQHEIFERMRRARVADADRRVIMVSWELVLDRFAAAVLDFGVRSDIHQLQGLVQRQNEDAFPPLTDMTVSGFADRDSHLRKLVGDAVDRGRKDGFLSVKGLSWTNPTRTDCFGRYFSVIGADAPWARLSIEYREDRFSVTPLWIMTRSKDWQGRDRLPNTVCGENGKFCWTPVRLRDGVVYGHVLRGVVSQLRDLSDALVADVVDDGTSTDL